MTANSALRTLLLALFLVSGLVAVAAESAAPRFPSEAQAQEHCPKDVVVWLNIPTHIYHLRGMRWYGRTKNGAFVCRMEADNEGDRGPLNGQ